MTNNTVLFIDLDATVMVNPFVSAVFPHICTYLSERTRFAPEEILIDIRTEHARRLSNPTDHPARVMDWDDIVRTVARRYGTVFPLSLEQLVIRYSTPPYIQLLDNAYTALSELCAVESRRCIASSMGLSRYQFPVLKALGLYQMFDEFLMPDITGYLKTDRRFYGNYLQASNTNLIAIGDKYIDDILPPKMFGMSAVLVSRAVPELAGLSPFARPYFLPPYFNRLTGQPIEMPIIPDAHIVSLNELHDVIPRLEEMVKYGQR